MGDRTALDDATEDERVALEEIERGLEELRRAHGALVEFHHAVGRGIDHFDEAEGRLDERDALAERLREEVLPAGVTDDGKLTYQLVAEFEEGLLADVESVGDEALAELADGRRYPIERAERDELEESA
ncbi:hypothetical protein HTZ84_15060 [Haloterrigena sp. SYSU A558-1]|uniref:Uncharacterized protein n=1 Tax=Haloterrigena gelatinilytica TaxID=2741724 RepID=A0A8J8GJ91_9EURY|nr:hypothetical protein [Haloterrigena gelatinilytica]NUB90571.1 hypothetical protein [Haloterrigena gelatinilytica]NUC73610.1 hypothetical protein [Haloterrigena gelatinilytica]